MKYMKNVVMHLKKMVWYLPKLSYALSNDSLAKAISCYLKLVLFSVTRKFSLKNVPKNFNFVFNLQSFSIDLYNNLDLAVLVEIFVLNEYDWALPKKLEVQNILDLGAHWGDTAIYYSLVYPEAQVYSVEPFRGSFDRLKVISETRSNIHVHHAALSDKDGKMDLHVSSNSVGNSVQQRAQSSDVVVVPAITIETLMRTHSVQKFDLIKFDIEGAEEILFNNKNLTDLSSAFIGEIHLDLIPSTLERIRDLFVEFEVTFTFLKKDRYIMKAVRKYR